jgi:CHAT domain-containing protein
MVSFYRRMFVDGLAPGAALRAAKLELLRSADGANPAQRHPANWAAFVLWGAD